MKNKFIASTLVLILGGFVTKILGFVIRIIYTRIILEEGVGLYSLITPTYSLLITIATLALPLAISKLVAEERRRSIKIICSSIVIICVVNALLMGIMFFFSHFIASGLLKMSKRICCFFLVHLLFLLLVFLRLLRGIFLENNGWFLMRFRIL